MVASEPTAPARVLNSTEKRRARSARIAARRSAIAAPIEVRGPVKGYGEILAVDHVDLTVEPGDVFGYLGPNGVGKTTSLRTMPGLIAPKTQKTLISRVFCHAAEWSRTITSR